LLIDINGDHYRRPAAKISVFDSGFMLGDGAWEGIRLHHGRLAFLDRHLDRLWRGAKAIHMDIGITREEMERRLYAVLDANGMDGAGVHIRLMVTRGIRSTPYQDPRVVVTPATIVMIPEWKEPVPETATRMHADARHGACSPRLSRRAGPDAQFAKQAQLHYRLHSGSAGRGGRGPDARPARLRCDLQFDALLQRARG